MDQDNEKEFSIGWTITIATIICVVLWVGGMFLTQWYADNHFEFNSSEGNKYALFGDSFGSVNALISAFAFAGVIVAIVIQRNELRLQRKDLELQREEFKTQNETLHLQRFENTFFNMLSLQQEIVNNLYFKQINKENIVEDAPDPSQGRLVKEVIVDKIIQGRELFRFSFDEIIHHFKLENGEKKNVGGMRRFLHFKGLESYDDSYTPSYFDHYFRHLYTIIKFVDKSNFLSFEEKYKYTTMVRATLSRYELVWLYYNGLSLVGKQKFKKLIEKYSLLKNIREDLLTLSKENANIITTKGYDLQLLFDNGYSGTDYNFWLTAADNDNEKYYIGAFYKGDNLEEARRIVSEWDTFYNNTLR
ncbi:putative phage abortive infection protein [Bacteroidales bacterium OttesenSCG-928-M11]|nr:putative phage abortive infection protein [Bacteroidales bacterium OttesenSCG-928-M11]